MPYAKHLFFCVNQREGGLKCCNSSGATEFRAYAKERVAELGLAGKEGVRVNMSGCLGRCADGPSLVVYPDGVWYRYASKEDLDEIIQRHIIENEVVDRLLMDNPR